MEVSRLNTGLCSEFGVNWSSSNSFRLRGYDFQTPSSFGDFLAHGDKRELDKMYLAKTPELIRRYLAIIKEKKPRNIVELGIFRGGSVAFLQLVANPKRLLALEISPDRLDHLDKFIQSEGVSETLRVAYGVDQTNSSLVRQNVTEHLGEGRCIDLVFDDASHILTPTRTSFETLFPLIRAGGSFIVEDYASAHILATTCLPGALEDSKSAQRLLVEGMRQGLDADRQPLHLLAVEAMLASVVAPGLIQKVIVDRHWLKIVRGQKDFENPDTFDLRLLAEDQFGLLESRPSEAIAMFLDDQKRDI